MRTPPIFLLLVATLSWLATTALCYNSRKIAMGKNFIYRLYLADKKGSPYSITHPEQYLSQRAIRRRQRQAIAIDSTDLPVSPAYVARVKQAGLTVMGTSRWHNTITVSSSKDNIAINLAALPFVKKWFKLYESPDSVKPMMRNEIENHESTTTSQHNVYGPGYRQIQLENGILLHNAGFRGKGMLIAILDAGFNNADKIEALSNVSIKATADFAPRRSANIFAEHAHGTMVLSVMAANNSSIMTGSAPEADYALIRTEDMETETPAEEDSWTMGAEFADSIGADLINSSLGYTHWDGDTMRLHLRDLNGQSYVSQTAAMLASKGIILCNSAGNEGSSSWHKVNIPADATDILTVGAIDTDSLSAPFSSLGPTQDGRIKPDISAMGVNVSVIGSNGVKTTNNGTSFASPIVCGLTACLWQALPTLNARQLMSLIRLSADRAQWPDNVYGYGIPDFWKAYNNATSGFKK